MESGSIQWTKIIWDPGVEAAGSVCTQVLDKVGKSVSTYYHFFDFADGEESLNFTIYQSYQTQFPSPHPPRLFSCNYLKPAGIFTELARI